MRFASLGSGSRGNALVIETGKTKLLVDNGFPLRVTEERLAGLAMEAKSLTALLLTHEHSDHVAGVFRLAERLNLPVYLTEGTLLAVQEKRRRTAKCRVIDSQQSFAIDDLEIHAFPVPHDAREPVQYLFSDGARRLGLLTDAGSVTPHILSVLKQCHALILECNHDVEKLRRSKYPASLKKRISGGFGHLSNAQAAAVLQQIDTRSLQHIIAAHLSQENNSEELAMTALAKALNCSPQWIGIARQENGFTWREVR